MLRTSTAAAIFALLVLSVVLPGSLAGKDNPICHLPKVTGPCKAYFVRWYFDDASCKCRQFVYGGCRGNLNNFDSKWECIKACAKASC